MIKSHSPFSQEGKKSLNVAVYLNTAKLSVTNPLKDFLYTHTLPNTHICICAFLIPDRLPTLGNFFLEFCVSRIWQNSCQAELWASLGKIV